MQKLAKQITNELQTAEHCAIYENELVRVWPVDGKRREVLVTKFAEEHGWRVRHYKDGFVVIFDKAPVPRKRD